MTPPAIRSPQTTFKDNTIKELASEYGLSDLKSNKHGQAVKRQESQNGARFENPASSPVMGRLAQLGSAGDGFSSVMPAIERMGGPRSWNRVPERRR